MHLSRLYIENFRSIRKLDLHFTSGKNVIIGRNNAGKSNVIRALDLVLGEGSPTYARSENVTIDDFYAWRDPNSSEETPPTIADDVLIWCELSRDDGEALNYDEIYKCFGFKFHASIVRWERPEGASKSMPVKEPVRFPASDVPSDLRSVFDIAEDDGAYVNPKLRHQKTFETVFDPCTCFGYAFLASRNEHGRIEKEIRFLYRESPAQDWIVAFSATVRTELLQSAIIPSFRDPQAQLRLTSWTWFGKLMRHLVGKHEESPDLQNALNQVRDVSAAIFADVQSELDKSSLRVAFPGTRLSFQLAADTKSSLYKNSVIYVDDGFRSPLVDKGAGIQSATIIGLFNYYTHHVNTSASALLCIEEPELYLHPHARRVVSDRLDEFLDRGRHQVILTTHSAEFVRTTRTDVTILRTHRDGPDTHCAAVSLKELRHLLLNPSHGEVVFADKVVICEGADEFVLRFVADEYFRGELDANNVSIVAVGGKDQFKKLVELAVTLGIKPFILADFDYLLRDKSADAKVHGGKPHDSLETLGEAIFSLSHLFGDKGSRALSWIQKMRSEIKSANPSSFYTAKTASEVSHVKLTDTLKGLRNNGLCILDGEIEDLFRQKGTLNANAKLSFDEVYSFQARLVEGEKLGDLLDDAVLRDFLKTVLDPAR